VSINATLISLIDWGLSIPSDAKSEYCDGMYKLSSAYKKIKVPPLYIGNGYELNNVPSSVTQLNQIEKQMVSLRLPFMKILAKNQR